MKNYATLGALLADVRSHNGCTQDALSKEIGYPYNIVSKWENNQAKPIIEDWDRLVKILGPSLAASPGLLRQGLRRERKEGEPETRPTRVEKEISQRLYHLRQVSGHTALAVCKATGIKPPAYTRIEKGEANPTYSQLRMLVKLYKTSYEYLIDGTGPQ